jgi:succinoglycan biosynthesis protein ExoV
MQLYYWRGLRKVVNFGDQLSPWLWKRVFPSLFDDDARELFLGVGTLLSDRVPEAERYVVIGSGAGYYGKPHIDRRWQIHAVRGPLTAGMLQLPARFAITDPAMLVRAFYPSFEPVGVLMGQFSFMPHWMTAGPEWEEICQELDFDYIDPSAGVDAVIEGISRAGVLITEAMHGAIVADAFGVPWIAVHSRFGDYSDFKWRDWCASVGLVYRSIPVVRPFVHPGRWGKSAPLWRRAVKTMLTPARQEMVRRSLQKASRAQPLLSSRDALDICEQRLWEQIESFGSRQGVLPQVPRLNRA